MHGWFVLLVEVYPGLSIHRGILKTRPYHPNSWFSLPVQGRDWRLEIEGLGPSLRVGNPGVGTESQGNGRVRGRDRMQDQEH